MKALFFCLALMALPFIGTGQVPQKISYQIVIRDAENKLVQQQQVGIQLSIVQGSVDGVVVYSETHTKDTNINGLLSIQIGGDQGFEDINWSKGPWFIKTEVDPAGGNNYTIISVSELLSVPYAKHAGTFDRLLPQSDDICNNESEGAMRYNPVTKCVEYCNGLTWISICGGSSFEVPDVTTGEFISSTSSSGRVSFPVVEDDGGGAILSRGVCWGTSPNPSSQCVERMQGESITMHGLNSNATYYYRAYATNAAGTGYGEDKEFITTPHVVTLQASAVTSTSFTTGGTIAVGGNNEVYERGIVFGNSTYLIKSDDNFVVAESSGTGSYPVLISLSSTSGTYYRAYAINEGGISYGSTYRIAVEEPDFTGHELLEYVDLMMGDYNDEQALEANYRLWANEAQLAGEPYLALSNPYFDWPQDIVINGLTMTLKGARNRMGVSIDILIDNYEVDMSVSGSNPGSLPGAIIFTVPRVSMIEVTSRSGSNTALEFPDRHLYIAVLNADTGEFEQVSHDFALTWGTPNSEVFEWDEPIDEEITIAIMCKSVDGEAENIRIHSFSVWGPEN